MSYNRSLDYLNHRHIIYRTTPKDKPTKEYDWGLYYEDGTYDCYDLFRSKAKITTYKSLKWHLLVLWYLNPKLEPDDFQQLAEVICYDIYAVMLDLNDNNEQITINKIAKVLECTTRTIHRNMGNELKKEKELLNQNL